MVNKTAFKALSLLLGVFCLGGTTGIAATLAYVHYRQGQQSDREWLMPRGGSEVRRVRALTRILQLTPEQSRQFSEILTREEATGREQMRTIMESCGAPLREHKARVDAELRKVLTPEQQTRFDTMLTRQSERLFLRQKARQP